MHKVFDLGLFGIGDTDLPCIRCVTRPLDVRNWCEDI